MKKFIGCFPEQDIKCENYQKAYCYTKEQSREVILYYTFNEICFVLKQLAICSEMTESYSMYWVFSYDYVNKDYDDFKKTCLSIVENELIPNIEKYQQTKITSK